MQNAKTVTTPLAANFKLSFALCPQSEEEVDYMSKVQYSSAIGSLMYAIVCLCPDLVYAISAISKYLAKPSKEH